MGINNSDFARGFGNTTFVVPPGWGKPGYVPASKVPLYLGIQMTLTAIMVTVVALRIYTRIFLVRALGWDDAWVLMASVSCIGLMTMHILSEFAHPNLLAYFFLPCSDIVVVMGKSIQKWDGSSCDRRSE